MTSHVPENRRTPRKTICEPSSVMTRSQGNYTSVYDGDLLENCSWQLFEPDYWTQHHLITGKEKGRGTVWFISFKNRELVLRHYFRGGLISRLVKDKYFFSHFDNCRATREFNLLRKLNELNLPVPKPIAYRVTRDTFTYRADILLERIVDAKTLANLLCEQEIGDELWLNIGQTIAKFHEHNICHSDLNAHNILIQNTLNQSDLSQGRQVNGKQTANGELHEGQKVWLIDFDRSKEILQHERWKQANLKRLLRSLKKESRRMPNFHWKPEFWQLFMQGYHG